MPEQTQRSRLKAERRRQLLQAAARLFADRGFRAVSIEDLGAAVGVSGPAVYRYFPSKETILAEMLEGVSRRLLEGGAAEAASGGPAAAILEQLVAFHTDFALNHRDLIRVYDRDFASLPPNEAKAVRRLQRAYVELWVDVLRRVQPSTSATVARTKAHATFGLLNSTPYIAANQHGDETRRVLERMALCALAAPDGWPPGEEAVSETQHPKRPRPVR
jgi:AcrR family transcriptional regulator